MMGPFAAAALEHSSYGLAVIPTGGDRGKVPLIRWANWKRPPGSKYVRELIGRYPEANIGILTGLSAITVVDVDDRRLVEPMCQRFGETPLMIETPSGGVHLWYRSNGERCANLRDREGIPVDIKAEGGFVVVPPSPGYRFLRGSFADLKSLPRINAESLSQVEGGRNCTHKQEGDKASTHKLRSVRVGHRNWTLFRKLLREVKACDTQADLLDVAQTIVDSHFEADPRHPFSQAEVRDTVARVWRYEQQGRNWTGKEARAVTTAAELQILGENPDALTLRLTLQCAHGARPEPFAVICKAMAQAGVITGWTDFRRYARACDWLLERGFLQLVHRGGRQRGDAHLYKLSSPVQGAEQEHLLTDARGYGTGKAKSLNGRGRGASSYIGSISGSLSDSAPFKLEYGGRPTLAARALGLLQSKPGQIWSRAELMAELDIGPGEAQRLLARLCEHRSLKRLGHGRYRLNRAA